MKAKMIVFYVSIFPVMAMSIMAGINNLQQTEMAVSNMDSINMPLYMCTILGTAKILGVIGVLQRFNSNLNELSYAGYTFLFSGAVAAHILNGDEVKIILMPFFFLVLTIIAYQLRSFRGKI